jgi:hypothetical protein
MMGQYEIIATVSYKYIVEANNDHEAVSIYINDNDSCIPLNCGELNIKATKIDSATDFSGNESRTH